MLVEMTPETVRAAISEFSGTYRLDWKRWTDVLSNGSPADQAAVFRRILKKWQAVRSSVKGRTIRQTRSEAGHPPPFVDDLLEQASPFVTALGGFTVRDAGNPGTRQSDALAGLWNVFADLPTMGEARCVGITKAVQLATAGRVGPALDSQVRQQIRVREPRDPAEWFLALRVVAADIRSFETRFCVQLEDLVDPPWRPVHVGRVYDMVFGPRGRRADD